MLARRCPSALGRATYHNRFSADNCPNTTELKYISQLKQYPSGIDPSTRKYSRRKPKPSPNYSTARVSIFPGQKGRRRVDIIKCAN